MKKTDDNFFAFMAYNLSRKQGIKNKFFLNDKKEKKHKKSIIEIVGFVLKFSFTNTNNKIRKVKILRSMPILTIHS